MKLYGAIDLHSNNAVCGLLDEQDQVKMRRKTRCELDLVLGAFAPFNKEIVGIAVESTFNWYWLVDGLMEAGYRVHLVNTSAVKHYKGLKQPMMIQTPSGWRIYCAWAYSRRGISMRRRPARCATCCASAVSWCAYARAIS